MPDDDETQGRTLLASAPTAAADPAMDATMQSDGTDYKGVELPAPGYQLGSLLGRGGMGEVIAAEDQRMGREVAYKRMRERAAGTDATARFLREARIQARLDHPAIVPVYELGTDSEGRPYFTMKRLAGKTLAERLQSSKEIEHPLLRAFAEVCLAIELAHTKGIVHRDLKPANIMLGDFGEVYVLDWGVARVMSQRHSRPSSVVEAMANFDSIGEATSGGTLLGTLGYMSPEQLRGEIVGPKTDVYALGSILFEILAGEFLHPRGHAAIASTQMMETASPSERRPDRAIPPELDALCKDMLSADEKKRPTAREVADRVQRYLDGDRDLEARRELAESYLEKARDALASGDSARRAEALRLAGRALGLDPHSREAADLVTGIILEPPTEHPAELKRKLADQERDMVKARARRAAAGYLSLFALSAGLPFFHIESWGWLVALWIGIAAFIVLSWRTGRTGTANIPAVLLGTIVMAVLMARAAGPFALVPALLCGTMLSISNIPFINDRPLFFYGWVTVAATLPLVLEWVGVLSTTVSVTGSAIEVESAILAPTGWVALPALAVANVVFLLIVARFAILVARDRRTVQRQLTVQAWHLGHLLPETPQDVAAIRASRL